MRLKKALVLTWIVFNVVAVLLVNEVVLSKESWRKYRDKYWNVFGTKAIDEILFRTGWYSYLTGLDQRYSMFSTVHREFWWYEIKARLIDGELVTLPLERQSSRSFFERNFFDFKAGKFHLNLYSDDFARKAYSQYLCRKYRESLSKSIDQIEFEHHFHLFAKRYEAEDNHRHYLYSPTISRNFSTSCIS
jgi:hypothetical protein